MNKNIALFIVIFQAFFANFTFARTLTVDGLIFGDEDNLVTVGTSVPKEKLEQIKPEIISQLMSCENDKLHPFDWQTRAPAGVSFVFLVNGSLPEIHARLEKYTEGHKDHPVWIWGGIDPKKDISLNIHLTQNGTGYIRIIQGGVQVGYTPCMSSPVEKQVEPGETFILTKGSEKKEAERGVYSRKWKVWMPWALEIKNSNQGCYIHGGSLVDQSDGCIHVPRCMAETLYHMSNVGTELQIVHLSQ